MEWKDDDTQKYTSLKINNDTNPEIAKQLINRYYNLKIIYGVIAICIIVLAAFIFFSGKEANQPLIEFTVNNMGNFKGVLSGGLVFTAILILIFGVNISSNKN